MTYRMHIKNQKSKFLCVTQFLGPYRNTLLRAMVIETRTFFPGNKRDKERGRQGKARRYKKPATTVGGQ